MDCTATEPQIRQENPEAEYVLLLKYSSHPSHTWNIHSKSSSAEMPQIGNSHENLKTLRCDFGHASTQGLNITQPKSQDGGDRRMVGHYHCSECCHSPWGLPSQSIIAELTLRLASGSVKLRREWVTHANPKQKPSKPVPGSQLCFPLPWDLQCPGSTAAWLAWPPGKEGNGHCTHVR